MFTASIARTRTVILSPLTRIPSAETRRPETASSSRWPTSTIWSSLFSPATGVMRWATPAVEIYLGDQLRFETPVEFAGGKIAETRGKDVFNTAVGFKRGDTIVKLHSIKWAVDWDAKLDGAQDFEKDGKGADQNHGFTSRDLEEGEGTFITGGRNAVGVANDTPGVRRHLGLSRGDEHRHCAVSGAGGSSAIDHGSWNRRIDRDPRSAARGGGRRGRRCLSTGRSRPGSRGPYRRGCSP